jgi:Ca-activated chloride channel family protein
VTIEDQIAVTIVEQTFANTSQQDLTGSYWIRKPRQSKIFRFVTWIDGQRREGKVFEREAARAAYNQAVASGQQAALVEQRSAHDPDVFSVELARIPAGSEQRVELSYIEPLAYDNGRVAYRFPLAGVGTIGTLAVELTVRSRVPLRGADAGGIPLVITREGELLRATLASQNATPSSDLELAYRIARDETGIDLIAHRPDAEADGYFMLLLTPRERVAPAEIMPKDMTFVLDVSGSMKGERIEMARSALRYCLRSLKPKDRFNIIRFSTDAWAYNPMMQHPTLDNLRAVETFVENIQANGGTNIHAGLLRALELAPNDPQRSHIVIFLTDGIANQGIVDPEKIVAEAVAKAGPQIQLFTFGVGHDLNEVLLRRIADSTRAACAFVRQNHELELAISNFQRNVSDPMLAGLELDFGGAGARGLYPRHLTHVFAGRQLMILGRYQQPGRHDVIASGTIAGQQRRYALQADFPSHNEQASVLPLAYALLRIQLIEETLALAPEGAEELQRELVRLSLAANMASSVTSFLVVAEGEKGALPPQPEATKDAADGFSAGGMRRLSARGGGGAPSQTPQAPPSTQPTTPQRNRTQAPQDLGQQAPKEALELKEHADRESQPPTFASTLDQLNKLTLPAEHGTRLELLAALALAGTTRELGEAHTQLASLVTTLHEALAQDATLGGSAMSQALALVTLSRLHEVGGTSDDQRQASALAQLVANRQATSADELAWLALGLACAERAGIACDGTQLAQQARQLTGNTAVELAAQRLCGLTCAQEHLAALPGDHPDENDLLWSAVTLAGTPQARSLQAMIRLRHGQAAALDAARLCKLLLADGALYTFDR